MARGVLPLVAAVTGFDAAQAGGGSEYACYECKDWGTEVTDGKMHPCPKCRREDWKAWKASQLPQPGSLVAVKSVSQLCQVIQPSAVGLGGENCIEVGQTCCTPVVLVQSIADGAVWWADLPDVEVLPPQQ